VDERVAEIEAAAQEAGLAELGLPRAHVIPVRMSEAWLMVDERAVRWAAGNPRGTEALNLPDLSELEDVSDPKDVLYRALRIASGLSGRRLRTFNVHESAHLVARKMESYLPLRRLRAFKRLEQQLEELAVTLRP